jgi:preprotein translocase subunit SecF
MARQYLGGLMKSKLKHIYEKHYKKLLIIPFLLLFLAILQIAYQTSTTGDFINKGVSLKGGINLEIMMSYDADELQGFLADSFPKGDVSVRSSRETIYIEASDIEPDELLEAVEEKLGTLTTDDYALKQIGSSLGDSFFKETFKAVIYAFILMGLVVFVTFRTPTPSLAVILAALSDIIIAIAVVNIIGMKVSAAGIAGFLMLIGYSVDTDILLSTRVLKRREGTVMERIYKAMGTGFTMTITTIAAIIVAMFLTKSDVIQQIMIIILIGLLIDLINTWIQNVGILRLYLERKERKEHHYESNH